MLYKTKTNKIIRPFDGVRPVNQTSHLLDTECLTKLTSEKRKMIYSGLKMVGVSFVVFVLLIKLSSVGSTMSYFSDIEKSIGNYLRADPLYFSVALQNGNQIDLNSGEQTIVPTLTLGEDSEPLQYFVTAKMTAGDSNLCGAIDVLGTFPFPYDGPLLGILTATTTEIGSWALSISLATSTIFAENTWCNVDLVYKGWNADVAPGKGYSSTEKISLSFYIPAQSATTTIASVIPDAVIENLDSKGVATTATTTSETITPDTPSVTENFLVTEEVRPNNPVLGPEVAPEVDVPTTTYIQNSPESVPTATVDQIH